MKKFFFIPIILLFLTSCIDSQITSPKVSFENGITVSVEIADKDDERMKGLMFRKELEENHGMLFIFDDEKPRSFWMKNTLIPLDMIFINKDFEIVKILQAEPCESDSCILYSSDKPVNYVVEVNKGFCEEKNISQGMKIKIEK
ncbi:MAG: DUF192 domain-containing protein [Nanoarchaeota archaeon]|nr:DUF192 domain-containing protein [Nanoarchaeota archaeon]MBU1030630.1 DUF192 domain-containing protein [Nanoarchaeota archaeon]MBU1849550.1 DUF192 domain-containing protein [Nanoarchaeota archaeon]